MFSHKSFLTLGEYTGANFLSLAKGGYELANCEFSFQQGIDQKGQASTKVYGGTFILDMPMLPKNEIIEWALNSHMYKKGAIVVLDDRDMPIEKIFFERAACVSMSIDYVQAGESSVLTKIVLHAESLVIDNGVDFDNSWTK